MYAPSPILRGLFRKKVDMNHMMEGHFWSLTRYRIGPCLLGLDYAGNIIFYPSYRKQRFGGWTAVTLGAPGSTSTAFLSSDTTAVNVLEDGYPMHYKASKKLQSFVSEERRKWQLRKKDEATRAEAKKKADEAAKSAAVGADAKSTAAAGKTTDAAAKAPRVEITEEDISNYDPEQQFRDMLAIKCSNPRFINRQLRISKIATLLYKGIYFYLWAVLVSLIVQGYLLFRAWLNPPAREGIKNIEEHVLHLPRLLFAGCVYGLVWCVRTAQPVIDPIVNYLSEHFPQVNWGVASAENLANKAQHLADDTHPSAEKRREEQLKQQLATEQARRTWWTRVLMILLAIFSVLCVL